MKTLLAVAALCLACCQSRPSHTKLENAKLGSPPALEKAQERVRGHLAQALRDHGSAQIAFGKLQPGWYYPDSGLRYAWDLEVCVDDVNEFGMREGAKIHHYFFVGDELVAVASPDRTWYGRSYRYRYRIEEFGVGGLTAIQAGLAIPDPRFNDEGF